MYLLSINTITSRGSPYFHSPFPDCSALRVHSPDLPLHRRRSKSAHLGCLIRGPIEMRLAKETTTPTSLRSNSARFSFSLPLRSIPRLVSAFHLAHLIFVQATRVQHLSPRPTRKPRDVIVRTKPEYRHSRLETFALPQELQITISFFFLGERNLFFSGESLCKMFRSKPITSRRREFKFKIKLKYDSLHLNIKDV